MSNKNSSHGNRRVKILRTLPTKIVRSETPSKHQVLVVSPRSSLDFSYTSNQLNDLFDNIRHIHSDSSLDSLITSKQSNSKFFTNSSSPSNNRHSASKVSHSTSHKGNSTQHSGHDHDHDKISLSSLNMVLDDLKPRKDSGTVEKTPSQRRSSMLRRVWAQHTDVPYVIGAHIADDNHGPCGKILLGLSWFLMILFFPLSLFITLKVVQEYERAVIFRLGRLVKGGAKGPGLFIVLPCIESYTKVDMRTVSFDVPPQEVLTKDSVTVAVDAVVYYRVFNPVISIANVENAQESTRLLAQTSLRNVLGTNSLAEILSNREAVSSCMREILDEATDQWGIKVERVEIKDVRLPIQLQRAMAAEAEATREARAKVIAAEGEHKASRALKDAADILSESSSAIQLRYLQTLNNIAAEKNSTIVFPLPIELLANFMNYTTAKINAYENKQVSYYTQNSNSHNSHHHTQSLTNNNILNNLSGSKLASELQVEPNVPSPAQLLGSAPASGPNMAGYNAAGDKNPNRNRTRNRQSPRDTTDL